MNSKIKKINLGVCAMDKKANSKPMRQILNRLNPDLYDITMFGDERILNDPIETWPVVECLITFYSSNFPIEKALKYIELRNPFLINDLHMNSVLVDRTQIYDMLESLDINVPKHVYCDRRPDPVTGEIPERVIEEYDDYIVIDGKKVNKPFVEKPFNAEDHNIYIYYPMSTGGGSKRLFRKVNNRSSEFYPNCHEIRREGSYIYEEFLVTQGTDVKVYALGPNYGHAEARKSPVVDGRVQRDSTGLEVRYPVILSIAEKEISRKITEAFKQTVCGFDILRVQGKKSYVCDVNGWSFVKNSRKYYDDASQVLSEFIASKLRPDFEGPLVILPAREVKTVGKKKEKQTDTAMESEIVRQNRATLDICDPDEELVCVVGVMRHGDRTPKQKLKVMSTHQKYLDFFHHYAKSTTKELKVKTRASLLHFLATTVEILQEYKHNDASYHTQLDYYRVLRQIRDVLERFEISGINRKLQMKPAKWTVDTDPITGKQTKKASELLLIMKWGGDLTPLGRDQAESLGAEFRQFMYPDAAGGGVLRLHSTYRHDLKIKSSDEGRVMKTGAAFAKGLLELEGSLTPILASLVTVEEKGSAMLDKGGNTTVKEDMDRYHHHLNLLQLLDSEMNDEMVEKIAPECSSSVKAALFRLGNPRQALRKMYRLMEVMIDQLEELCVEYEAEDEEDAFLHSRIQTPFKVPTPDIIVSDSGPGSGPTAVVAVPGSTNAPSTPLVNRKASLSDAAPSNSMFCSLHNDSPSAQSRPNSTASRPSSATSRASISSKPFAFPNNTNAISGSSPPRQTATTSNSSQDASDKESTTKPKLYLGETHSLRRDRWEKIHNDFYDYDTDQFELTKVPDVYDMVKYDCIHNSHIPVDGMNELFYLTREFADCVVPQEFGIHRREKRVLGSMVCDALCGKIKNDLRPISHKSDVSYSLDHSHAEHMAINSLERSVRTRLYFTSESHLHSLLNVLRFPVDPSQCAFDAEGLENIEKIPELCYLTQMVFRVFAKKSNPGQYRCEIFFSPGATNDPITERHRTSLAPYVHLNRSISLHDLCDCLDNAKDAAKERSDSSASDDDALELELEGKRGDGTSPPNASEPMDHSDAVEGDHANVAGTGGAMNAGIGFASPTAHTTPHMGTGTGGTTPGTSNNLEFNRRTSSSRFPNISSHPGINRRIVSDHD